MAQVVGYLRKGFPKSTVLHNFHFFIYLLILFYWMGKLSNLKVGPWLWVLSMLIQYFSGILKTKSDL